MTFSLHRSVRAFLSILTLAGVLFSGTASAATYTLAPLAYQTVLDTNGNPVSGAKICTYLAGTTTPTATYSDSIGTPNANPIVADSSGRFVAYLSPGASYKFIFQDATGTAATCNGVVIRTQDNISAVPAASVNLDVTGTAGEALTAGQAVYLSDGSGSKAAGQWFKADSANAYSSSVAVSVGMVPNSITSGAAGTIRLAGQMTGLSSLTLGGAYYVGTAGAITATAPANARKIGEADTTSTLVLPLPPLNAPWYSVTTTSTGTQNDFAPGLIGNTIIRCNNATLLTINGLSGGYDGQRVILVSIGAGQVDLAPQNVGSSAANRLINFAGNSGTLASTSLAAGSGTAEYVYDTTTARWRLVSHEQGAWITPAYGSGGSYTASAGTWTVDSGDVTTQAYYLKGRTMTVTFNLVTTSVSTTPASLNITNAAWGGFTSAKALIGQHVYADNGAAFAVGYVASSAAGTTLTVNKITGNWAAAANTTSANGQITFEVQ